MTNERRTDPSNRIRSGEYECPLARLVCCVFLVRAKRLRRFSMDWDERFRSSVCRLGGDDGCETFGATSERFLLLCV